MGRAPCCEKIGLKKGPWTAEEDLILIAYIRKNGHGNWRALPKQAGLLRCGKSCRLRWINYLRPDIKRGNFTPKEEETIIKLHGLLGNKWSKIAAQLPGRTDNEIKNVWNTHLRKELVLSKEASDSPSGVESKEICSNSFSSSESTLSSLNQSEMTQDAKQDANNVFLDVDSVCRTDRRKEEANKEHWPGYPIEIPVEPNLDLGCEMIEVGLNHSDPSLRLSHLVKDVDDNCNDQFGKPNDITYSASHRYETKPSLSYSSSFSSSTTFSTFTCSNPSTSTGQADVNMTTDQFIEDQDDWMEMFTLANESNIYDFRAMLGDEWGACMQPNMVDQKNEHVGHALQNPIIETTKEEESKGAGEWWLEKLENEPELSGSGNGFERGDQSNPTKGPDNELSASSNLSYEGVLEFDIDPIIAYFQSQSLLQQFTSN